MNSIYVYIYELEQVSLKWYMDLSGFEMCNDGLILIHLIPAADGEANRLSFNILLQFRQRCGELN